MRFALLFLGAPVLLIAMAAGASQPAVPIWQPVDASTGKITDPEDLQALGEKFPDSGTVRLRLLNAQLQADNMEGAMETLEWLYERGYVFGDVPKARIPRLMAGVDPGRIAERLIADAQVIEASDVVAITPAIGGLVESVVRDPYADRLIVSSVSEKGVLGKRASGDWDGFKPEGIANLSGMALDLEREIVWFGSGSIDGSDHGPDLFRGLLGIALDAAEETRIAAPEGVSISDVTLAADGTVYASDPIGGGIYFAQADDEKMAVLIAPGTFRSPQGLVTSADGRSLYVSDYRYGLARVELSSGRVRRVSTSLPVILDGVDGLWRHGNELIAVQNGTSPMRISAFTLADDGYSIIGHRILEQANREWTEPLSGSIDGDALLYIGNGQWDRYVAGELGQDLEPQPTQIRRLPLKK